MMNKSFSNEIPLILRTFLCSARMGSYKRLYAKIYCIVW